MKKFRARERNKIRIVLGANAFYILIVIFHTLYTGLRVNRKAVFNWAI